MLLRGTGAHEKRNPAALQNVTEREGRTKFESIITLCRSKASTYADSCSPKTTDKPSEQTNGHWPTMMRTRHSTRTTRKTISYMNMMPPRCRTTRNKEATKASPKPITHRYPCKARKRTTLPSTTSHSQISVEQVSLHQRALICQSIQLSRILEPSIGT